MTDGSSRDSDAGFDTAAVLPIGGQMLCLLLSLLVTPVSYSIFDDWSQGRFFRKKARETEGAVLTDDAASRNA